MQRDIGNIHTIASTWAKQFLCKMQSCCRRSCQGLQILHIPSDNGFVLKLMGNIGRQRHFTGNPAPLPRSHHKKTHQAISIFLHIQNFCTQTSVAKDDLCTGAQLFAGFTRVFPQTSFSIRFNSRISTATPVSSFAPSRRAGITFVLFKTRQSPGLRTNRSL